MNEEFPKDGNALTRDPIIYMNWRSFKAIIGDDGDAGLHDRHITNYQAVILKLHNTWEANKASAHANSDLIKALRKKIKKAKRALK
jgi:hypothetical protein